MKTRINRKTDDFIKMFNKYEEHWHDWTTSGVSFLKEKEIAIINNFLLTGAHSKSAVELNMLESNVSSIFRHAKTRMEYNYEKYEIWKIYKTNNILGVFTDARSDYLFLNLPLECLKIEHYLKRKISTLQIKTFKELTEVYSIKDLYRMRGWGEKTIEELKSLLKENNCLHLLK